MLMIRLQRIGRRNRPEYRIVVTEKARAATSSNHVEVIGSYEPVHGTVSAEAERVQYWMEHGAQCSRTAHNLLIKAGALKGSKRAVKTVSPKHAGEQAAA